MDKYDIFSALSNPLRIRIIEILSRGPAPVSEIVSLVNASQPKVSSHLSILSNSGIVDSYQLGRERI